MIKQLIFSQLLTVTANCILYSQAPAIEWQKAIGGSDYEGINEIIPTNDGGYIIGASSYSNISGDKSENSKGDIDYWVVKINSAGVVEWDNTIGGNGEDLLYGIEQTFDGGYIIGGNSASGISGDKTEAKLGPSDIWILKLDSSGNIIWQNTIGGNGTEYLRDIHQLSDGNYIAGGMSGSNISGDKTENRMGPDDIWVLKLDPSGNIIWQNTIGGTGSDGIVNIYETEDFGFLVGAYSTSGANFDKTEPNIGQSDFWILKLDPSGNIIWQNTIGGTNTDDLYSLDPTSDGGSIIGGYSLSGISGDKTEAPVGGVNGDYWVVKIDSSGSIEWQNTIGGTGVDGVQCIRQILDGSYIVAGYSTSCISGDKTDGCIGGTDYWIIKLNPDGTIAWNNALGGTFEDKPFSILQTYDLGYLIGGLSTSSISGDKTVPIIGGGTAGDIWLIKLFPDCIPEPETCNTLDDNCNGLIDDGVVESINISAGGSTTFCQGGNVLLSATYSGASIQWKKNGSDIPGAISSTYSVNKSGNYSAVTTSPCGTATSSTINVTVNKNPHASISAGGATTFCAGGSVTLTEIPVAGCTYQWYKGASLIAGATSTNYIATTAGNYKCRVTKTATGCYKNSNAISVTVPCKEGEWSVVSSEMEIKIYPNPNSGTFEISVQNLASATSPFEGGLRPARMNRSDGGMRVEIYNSLGQLIYTQQINSTDNNFTETISLENISSGIYFVRVGDGYNYAEQKLIIE